MKGNKKLLVIAVLVLLITVSFTTYAIYKTSVTTNAEVTAATWSVDFKNGETSITSTQNITFTESDCTSVHVAPGKIAPGASCSKTIKLVTSGTEVDVAYTATAGTVTATKSGSSVATTGANEFSTSLSPENGTITYSNTGTDTELTLTVSWAGTEGETVDTTDTGLNGATITVPVTLTAKQVVTQP